MLPWVESQEKLLDYAIAIYLRLDFRAHTFDVQRVSTTGDFLVPTSMSRHILPFGALYVRRSFYNGMVL